MASLEVFALIRHERSELYTAVSESWSQCEAHRALGVPNSVVYSYLLDVYRNRFAALHLAGRIAEAKFVTLSLGAFLQTVQHGLANRFAHDKIKSACVARDALLLVP